MENSYNDPTPNWLNRYFIMNILSKDDKSISLTKLDVKPAVPKGENFMSTLYRVHVEYKSGENEEIINKYIIIKCQPSGEDLQKFLVTIKGFEKEKLVFEQIFPLMQEISKSKFANELQFSAKYFRTEQPDIIVLEDLQNRGYRMQDRLKGLNFEHCIMVVKSLARFHGLSKKLEKINPGKLNIFIEGFYAKSKENVSTIGSYFQAKMEELATEVETWPNYEEQAKKIKELSSKAGHLMLDCVEPKEGEFNVLNHGDCWINNMMFQYCGKTGKIEDIKFVDFQLSAISSPALDLQYFITTSCADDVRYEKRGLLLEVYHAELVQTLTDLELDPDQYTLQQLREDFARKDVFGLLIACMILWDMLADKNRDEQCSIDETNFGDGSSNKPNVYKGKRYGQVLRGYLQYYSKRGII